MGDNINPELIAEGGFSIPFIVKFKYIVEDRRPDLSEETARQVLGYKYKTTVDVIILWRSFSITVRSLRFPHIL